MVSRPTTKQLVAGVLAGVAGAWLAISHLQGADAERTRADHDKAAGRWAAGDLARLFHENEPAGLAAVRRGATVTGKVELVRVDALGAALLEFDSSPGLAAEIPAEKAAELRAGQEVRVACSDASMVLRRVNLLRCNIS